MRATLPVAPTAVPPSQPAARRRVRAWATPRIIAPVAAALIFALALLPRVGAIAVVVTADEGNWMERTALFATAVARGDAAGTYLTGHPGVMTMWAGLLGMGFGRASYLAQNLAAGNISSDQPAYFDALVHGRVPILVLTSLLTVAVGLLAWRLFGAGVGLLAGCLLAMEPFVVAHSLVLHTDASLTSYMTLSELCALVYFWRRGGLPYFLASGVCAGLALLAKTPGLFIFLYVPFSAGLALLADPRRWQVRRWLRLVGLLVGWGLVAAITMLALWPALRADPVATLIRMATFTENTGGSDHVNYFLNESTGAPGLLYYPVTLAFRLSPPTALGLLLALAALAMHLARRNTRGLGIPTLLAAYCLLFLVMMDFAPKKFDRYLLPTYPTLAILSAAGYWWTARRLMPRLGQAAVAAGLVAVVGVQLWQCAGTRPYYLAYYNPLLGGAAAARDAIVVGWGEGMDVVARHLGALPNADSLTVATFYNSVFAAQFPGNIMSPNTYQPVSADYVLLYVNVSQRSIADRLRAAIRQREPYMSVRINGLEYVTVYQIEDDSVGAEVPAEFGHLLRLERYRFDNAVTQPGAVVQGLLRWKLVGDPPDQLSTALALVRDDGWVAYRTTVAVSGARPLRQWRPGDETVLSYTLVIPPDLPSGRYRLATAVGDPSSSGWLPVSAPPPTHIPSPVGFDTWVSLLTLQVDRKAGA